VPVQHTVLGGLDLDWQKRVNDTGPRAGPTRDVFNPIYDPHVMPATLTDQLAHDHRQLWIYAQDQMEPCDERLTVGGRQDYVSIDSDNTKLAPGVTTSYSQDPSAFTGRVGAAYVFDNGFVPYALYSKSFLPVLTLAPQLLKPTTGELKEVGVKYMSPEEDFSVTLSGFEATQQNVVQRVATVYHQTDEIRVRGIELEATANLWDGLNIIAAASVQD